MRTVQQAQQQMQHLSSLQVLITEQEQYTFGLGLIENSGDFVVFSSGFVRTTHPTCMLVLQCNTETFLE